MKTSAHSFFCAYGIMSGLLDVYFGPLDKKYCVYFLLVSMMFLLGFSILLINEIYFCIKNYNRLSLKLVSSGVKIMFNIFVAYFINRLLYTMCTKSLI